MDKLCPRVQKGYSNNRYCQEVLIGVVETIEKCNWYKRKGAVLSLDIRKAFDSLSHNYLQTIYKFYNFGPSISRWLTLLSTNRKACVVLENGLKTLFFDLERGNAQGDTLSPFLFNLGYQILLMKLEFDLQIEGLIEEVTGPPGYQLPHPPLQNSLEVSFFPPKVYAMADDATLLVEMKVSTLARIKKILEDFEVISGLGCNVDKTVLMQIGTADIVNEEIRELGVDLRNKITILGAVIENSGCSYRNNIDILLEKVRNQVRFWARFSLSLPGRINIAKTFMYSQLSYLGCILPIPKSALNGISLVIENFVNGPLRVGRGRIFLKKSEGGLGMIDLGIFLASQNCVWVKRAKNLDDNWKLRLFSKSYGDVQNIRSTNFNKNTEPLLHNMAKNYETFMYAHTLLNENFKESYLYENPKFPFENGRSDHFTSRFIDWELNGTEKLKLQTLKFSDFSPDGEVWLNHQEFVERVNSPVPERKFLVLKRAMINAKTRMTKDTESERVSESISVLFGKTKKLSRTIRKILEGGERIDIPPTIIKFAENTETIINLGNSRILCGLWGRNYFDNSMKTFLFKLFNNTLGYNYTVTKHVRGVDKDCTLCTLSRFNMETVETPLHLFFDCPVVEPLLRELYNWLYDTVNVEHVSRQDFFSVPNTGNTFNDKVLLVVNCIIKKQIWNSKLNQFLPQE